MIQAIYQNNRTGDAFELSSIMTGLTWSTKESGSPGKVEISLLKEYDTKIKFDSGSIVAIKDVENGIEKNLFYGYLFNVDTTKTSIRLRFYDQLRYLTSNATYVFKEQRLKAVIETIAKDFQLKLGYLENPSHIIRPLVMDNKKILDIILTALDDVLIAEKQLYVLFDNYGKLEVRKPQDMAINYILGDASLITDYNHSKGIDESYNYIKLVKDNQDTGEREAYIVKDSANMNLWGKLQLFEVADEKMNAAQITERANQLLELHNRDKQSLTIEGIGNLAFVAGRSFYFDAEDITKKGWYVIDEATHSFKGNNHTMSLTVRMV